MADQATGAGDFVQKTPDQYTPSGARCQAEPADLSPGVVADFARLSNDAMADLVRVHADRLLALANLPLQDPEEAAAELRRAVEDLGMVGAEIATRPGGRELDDEAFDVVWRTAAELDCLVLVHPHRSLAGRDVTRHFLGNLVGNPAETTVAIGHLVFGGVVERHPAVRFCFVHGGGFAPYQVGRWDHAYDRDARGAAALVRRRPSELLTGMWFDTVVHGTAALSHLLSVVGAGQVVLVPPAGVACVTGRTLPCSGRGRPVSGCRA